MELLSSFEARLLFEGLLSGGQLLSAESSLWTFPSKGDTFGFPRIFPVQSFRPLTLTVSAGVCALLAVFTHTVEFLRRHFQQPLKVAHLILQSVLLPLSQIIISKYVFSTSLLLSDSSVISQAFMGIVAA